MSRPTAAWWVSAKRYRRFADAALDFSEDAAQAMFEHETYGWHPELTEGIFHGVVNGYAMGKKWLDVTVAMWKRDLEAGVCCKAELYDDPAWQSPDDQAWLRQLLTSVVSGSLGWAYRLGRAAPSTGGTDHHVQD